MLESEYTTDALPSPPRDQEKCSPNNDKRKPIVSENDEEIEKTNECGHPPLTQAVVYVSNSKHVHVGDNKYYGQIKSEYERIHKVPVKETEQIRSLKNTSKAVTSKDIDIISQHICVGWELTARALGYTDGQIHHFEYKYNCRNLTQTLYDLIKDWIEDNGPDKATVGVLAQTLWDTNQKEAVKMWSENYDKIH